MLNLKTRIALLLLFAVAAYGQSGYIESFSPNAGSGLSATFVVNVNPGSSGAPFMLSVEIASERAPFPFPSPANSCTFTVQSDGPANLNHGFALLGLYDDTGAYWTGNNVAGGGAATNVALNPNMATFYPPTSQQTNNSQCTVYGYQRGSGAAGPASDGYNTYTFTIKVAFSPTFAGPKFVSTNFAGYTAQVGTWTVQTLESLPISTDGTPSGGADDYASTGITKFIGVDTTTRGNWRARYGTTGYILPATVSNLALGKPATQSSSISYYIPAPASWAVDGNTDGNFFDSSVTHTNPDTNAWWQVDLGDSAAINSISIWNRTDCCMDRLNDYWVFVSDTPFAATDTPTSLSSRAATWSSHQPSYPTPSASIPVNAQGRYVRVQLSGTNNMSLAEVQVFGNSVSTAWNPPGGLAYALSNGPAYAWANYSSDARALLFPDGSGNRIASCWYNFFGGTSPSGNGGFTAPLTFAMNFTDGLPHLVSFYVLDWDPQHYAGEPPGNRSETITLKNAATGAVLDTRRVTNFTGGAYYVWQVVGNVTIQVDQPGADNVVVSGIFID